MLIEQTIELQLREPGPPGRTYTLITVFFFFMANKISKENLRVDYYLLLKCKQETMHRTFPLTQEL